MDLVERAVLIGWVEESLSDFTLFFPFRAYRRGHQSLLSRITEPAEVLPGAPIRVALRIQDLRTWVFRSVELKDHPFRIRNARIRRRVQELNFVVREPEVDSQYVILQLLDLPGSDDYTADGRTAQNPRERHAGGACVMPTSHLLQRFHDAVAHLSVEGHERTGLRESCAGWSGVSAAVLACKEAAGKRAPNQDADVVVLRERLELVFETPTDEAVVHLCRHVFSQSQTRLQHNRGCRLP